MAGDPDDGQPEEVSVLGHDGVWHNTRMNGYTMCSMGRATPLRYETAPVTCMICIAMVADGFCPTQWRGGPLP